MFFLRPPRCPTGLLALLHVRLWLHALARRQGRVHHPHHLVWRRQERWNDWWDGWRDITSPSSQSLPWEHRRAHVPVATLLPLPFALLLHRPASLAAYSVESHPPLSLPL